MKYIKTLILILLMIGMISGCSLFPANDFVPSSDVYSSEVTAEKNNEKEAGITYWNWYSLSGISKNCSVTDRGIFYINSKGLICYQGFENNYKEEILCSDPSCMHIIGKPDKGIPITCDAQPPENGEIFVYGDTIYLLSNWVEGNQEKTTMYQKNIFSPGWKKGWTIDAVNLGELNHESSYVVDHDILYYAQKTSSDFLLQNGAYIQSAKFEVYALDLKKGTQECLLEKQSEIFQEIESFQYFNNRILFAYTGVPSSKKDECKKIFQQLMDFDELTDCMNSVERTQKVISIDIGTKEINTELELMQAQLAIEYDKRNYIVSCFEDQIVYVKDSNIYYYRILTQEKNLLREIKKPEIIRGKLCREGFFEMVTPADGSELRVYFSLVDITKKEFLAWNEKEWIIVNVNGDNCIAQDRNNLRYTLCKTKDFWNADFPSYTFSNP